MTMIDEERLKAWARFKVLEAHPEWEGYPMTFEVRNSPARFEYAILGTIVKPPDDLRWIELSIRKEDALALPAEDEPEVGKP